MMSGDRTAGEQAAVSEDDRILALTDAQVVAEHLARYGGDHVLAQKAIDLMRAQIQTLLAERWRQ